MSKDIHKWSDGRYTLMFDEHTFFVWDNEKDERMTALNVTKKLNMQQAIIQELERKLKKYANIGEEQLKQIMELQDLCGKSDGENAKLRIENKMLEKEVNLLKPTNIEQYEQIQKLQEENEQLKQKIDFYKYFQKDARELEIENEQLRKQVAEYELILRQHEFAEKGGFQ